jgi:hypothetical protein
VRHDRERLDAYIDTLVEALSGPLTGVGLQDPLTDDVWRPDIGDPLLDFLEDAQRAGRMRELRVVEVTSETVDIEAALMEGSILPAQRLLMAG